MFNFYYRASREILAQSAPREILDQRDLRVHLDPSALTEMMASRDLLDHLVPQDLPETAPRAHSSTEAGTTLITSRRLRRCEK